MTVQSIPLIAIDIIPGHNYREDLNTDDLEESMAVLGLLHPIHVIPRADGNGTQFLLNSGERRFQAARKLGWTEIDAYVMTTDDNLILELAAIDENIVRRALKGASLDRALSRRKEIYLQRHPETAQYVAGARASADPEADRPKSFTEDTADKTGKSPRTIERSVRRAERLSPATMEAYEQGLISQTQADILAGLPHTSQSSMLNKVVGKSVDETRALVTGELEEGKKKESPKEKTSMQHLEELYMHGQKIVAILGKLKEHSGLDVEFVDSVLNLKTTLQEEFSQFATDVQSQLEASAQDDLDEEAHEEVEISEEAASEEVEASEDEPPEAEEFFPSEPPF